MSSSPNESDDREKKKQETEESGRSLRTFERVFEWYSPCTLPNTSNSTDTRGSRQRGSSAAIPLELQRGISRSPDESRLAIVPSEESVSSGDEEDAHPARNPILQRSIAVAVVVTVVCSSPSTCLSTLSLYSDASPFVATHLAD